MRVRGVIDRLGYLLYTPFGPRAQITGVTGARVLCAGAKVMLDGASKHSGAQIFVDKKRLLCLE
jgi:hypothetical protein